MLILTSSINKKLKTSYEISVFDLATEKTVAKVLLEDTEIIGRMKTNLYHLIGGHMYFKNRCIKVRYDLIENTNVDLHEDILFDQYDEILKL